MNITGEAINSLSKRSRIPPCPGNIFPESFTPAVRLSKDSHKSPQVENMEVKIPIPIHWAVESIPGMMWFAKEASMIQNAKPPKNPSHDFFVDVYLTYNLRYMRRYRLSIRIQKEPSANIRYS